MNAERPKSLVSKEGYSNWLTVHVVETDSSFRIVPESIPTGKLSAVAIGLAACFVLFFVVVLQTDGVGKFFFLAFTVLLGMATITGVVLLIRHSYQAEQRKGVIFDYNKKTGAISLPRSDEHFEKANVVCFQIVEDFICGDEPVAEFQLVMQKEGVSQTFCLAKTSNSVLLTSMVRKLRRSLGFEVWIVKHQNRSGKKEIKETLMN